MPKFKMGDKIVINDNVNRHWWFKPGQKGVIIKLDGDIPNEDGHLLNIVFEGPDPRNPHNLKRRGYITEDMADHAEDAPAPVMGNFVFCSKGGKYYERQSFASLAAAADYAARLRRLHGTENIYPFVMVT